MRAGTVLTTLLLAIVGAGCANSSDEPTRGDERQPAAPSSPTPSPMDETADPPRSVEPVDCPPNASCLPAFVLDGVEYALTSCERTAADAVGDALDIDEPDAPDQRVPQAIHELKRFPVSVGVAVDWTCDQQALAMPTEDPAGAAAAVARARLRCEALAHPKPRHRCDRGGDARWHAGDGWYDSAFAPFPEAVEAADAAIADGERRWRADPAEVATRRYAAERVCHDGDGNACPLEVDSTRADGRAVVEGTAHPFPHVTWDVTIVVEQLGHHSWWTTAMTIEPRDAAS